MSSLGLEKDLVLKFSLKSTPWNKPSVKPYDIHDGNYRKHTPLPKKYG